MFGSELLEVGIGLVIVYVCCGVVCSGITEWITRIMDMRAKNLEDYITKLLGSPDLAAEIYKHPMIKELMKKSLLDKIVGCLPGVKRQGKPVNIDSKTFADVLTDILIKRGKGTETENKTKPLGDGSVESEIKTFLEEQFKHLEAGILGKDLSKDLSKAGGAQQPKETENISSVILKIVLDEAKAKMRKVEDALLETKKSVAAWFDKAMINASDWYKRKARLIVFIISLAVCAGMNIDTIKIAGSLYQDNTLRETVAAKASAVIDVAEEKISTDQKQQKLINLLEEVKFPMGWESEFVDVGGGKRGLPKDFSWIWKILGILLSTFAVSMGAPFWIGVLKKGLQLKQGKIPGGKPV